MTTVRGETVRLLLVEDDEDDYLIARDLLSSQDRTHFEIEWCQTYDSARDVIAQRRHDVYLIDYRLGSETGLGLMREAFDGERVPVIMLTGQAGQAEIDLQAEELGVTDFLSKSHLDAILLERTIRYAINHHRALAELRESQERARHDALHDSLTGLPNRTLFLDRLRLALARALRSDKRQAVLFIDIDRFKLINDSFSHAIGDEVLVEVGRRLDADLRPGDTVARLGGDEFTVLLEEIDSEATATVVARRIHDALRDPIQVASHELSIRVSIGIAVSERDSVAAELMRNADIAMYAAKLRSDQEVAVFDTSMHSEVVARLQVETELRKVLDERRLGIAYQPIVDLARRRINGLEALARWPEGSEFVSPAEFIPVAEDTGLILPLGLFVLDGACGQLARWRRAGLVADDVSVSVNVSGRQLADPDFPGLIRAVLAEYDLPGTALRVEMTESTVIDAPDQMREALDRIAELGVKAQLDDFGTGYSSLTFLHHFSGDAIKIDRSFVMSMHTDDANQEIIRAIIELAHNLGLRVIAEGVEEEEQLHILESMGCECAQGYLFAKPLKPEATGALLNGWDRQPMVRAPHAA